MSIVKTALTNYFIIPKKFKVNGDYVPINNKNEKIKIEVRDFVSLVLMCQRKYRASPYYRVTNVFSQSPNPWVRIQINMPNGNTYYSEGTSKKDAANKFANSYKF